MRIFRWKVLALLAATLILTPAVRAEVMVLVHGYHGNPDDWRSSGIVTRLAGAGWIDAGVAFYAPDGRLVLPKTGSGSGKHLITVHLPSEFPLLLQSRTLGDYLKAIAEAYPGERLIIVGHSAGGVVARSALVRSPARLPVAQLITIASPHLGTSLAEAGAFAASSPLSMVAPLMGAGTLNRSAQLYHDLQPEEPGTLLFALNRQPHPRIDYVSMVRRQPFGIPGDLLVSSESQRLEHVYALRGLARSIVAGFGHGLHSGDADVILRLLNGPRAL